MGTILVIVGLILAIISLFIEHRALLTWSVILVAAGVLAGTTSVLSLVN